MPDAASCIWPMPDNDCVPIRKASWRLFTPAQAGRLHESSLNWKICHATTGNARPTQHQPILDFQDLISPPASADDGTSHGTSSTAGSAIATVSFAWIASPSAMPAHIPLAMSERESSASQVNANTVRNTAGSSPSRPNSLVPNTMSPPAITAIPS